MKKFIVLLLAALMIAGLCISCKQDPEPDAFKGTWKGTDSDNVEYTIVCDGFGKVTLTEKDEDDTETVEGTYAASNGYVTLTFNDEREGAPIYFYLHAITQSDADTYPYIEDGDVGKYAIHTSETSEVCVFPDNYDEPSGERYIYFTKDGDTYSFTLPSHPDARFVLDASFKVTASSATLLEAQSVYKDPYDPEAVNELRCSETITAKYACTAGGVGDPWDYKLDNCSEAKRDMKTQYNLTSTTLTIYVGTDAGVEELKMIKQ